MRLLLRTPPGTWQPWWPALRRRSDLGRAPSQGPSGNIATPDSVCLCHLLFIGCHRLRVPERHHTEAGCGERSEGAGREPRSPRPRGTVGHSRDPQGGAGTRYPPDGWRGLLLGAGTPPPARTREDKVLVRGLCGVVAPSHQPVLGRGHPKVVARQAKAPRPPGPSLKPSFPRRRLKGNKEKEKKEGRRLSVVPGLGGSGPRGSQGQGPFRKRVLSWASLPVTQGWPARCGQHPGRTAPWGQRRSASRPRTGSRRGPTGPRWRAGGSGGGTPGRCSHGHPGRGPETGTIRGAGRRGGRTPAIEKGQLRSPEGAGSWVPLEGQLEGQRSPRAPAPQSSGRQ